MGQRVSSDRKVFTCISFSGRGVEIKSAAYDIPENVAPQIYMAGLTKSMPMGAPGVHIVIGEAFVDHAKEQIQTPPKRSKPQLRVVK